jgi:hypothetical protein
MQYAGGMDSDASMSATGIPKISYTNDSFSIEPEVKVESKKKKKKKELGADLK